LGMPLVFPGCHVGIIGIVAFGLALLCLVLLAEMRPAAFIAVQGIFHHQPPHLKKVGNLQGFLQLLVQLVGIPGDLYLFPELLFQLIEPGCPLIYVGDSAIMDMRSATYATAGPEAVLINLGLTEMGKHYGLPVLTTGFTSDAKELCMQSGLDGGLMAAMAHLNGADLVTGMGMLDSAQMLYLPKLILDAEVMRECRRLMQGVDLDEEHLLTDLIDEIGPGGHYLKAKVTKTMLRAGEHWQPSIFTRGAYEAWVSAPVSEYDRAVGILEDILAGHRPKALPSGAEEKISAILAAAAEELPER